MYPFSSAFGIFTRIDPIWGHNTSPNKFDKQNKCSDHNRIKVKIDNLQITGKFPGT